MKSTNMNQILREIVLALVVLASFAETAWGFVVTQAPLSKCPLVKQKTGSYGILSRDDSSRVICHGAIVDSSTIMVAQESWRQYVPLVVSVGIIIDILLGNPLANMVLKPMRPEEENDESDKDDKPRSKARVDAELIAQQALDKASNTLELQRYLEESKTDYDRMEEMKRKLDASMQDLDEDMEARQKSIDERMT